MRRRTLMGAALARLALWSSSVSVSQATVRVDHVQVPLHALLSTPGDKWTAWIFFIARPGRIPAEFNLHTFFDGAPRVFGCGPMTMDGYAVFENGQGIDPAPAAPVAPRRRGRGADLVRAHAQRTPGRRRPA